MKKAVNYLIISLIIIISIFIYLINKKDYLSTDDILGVYINDELSDKIPAKDEALFQKSICDDENVKVTWDNDNWGLLISNLNKKVKCNLYFYSGKTVFDFDYTGGEQTFIAPVSGTYKLETWGAQGNASWNGQGGYGGYSNGNIKLTADSEIFINVGGSGASGAYNNYLPNVSSSLKGGGATHIASVSGNLYLLSGYISDIFIISGGCGAGERENGGSGGGYIGGSGYPIKNTHPYYATGGTQTNGGTGFEVSENLKVYSLVGSFGTGGNGKSSNDSGPCGGSGLYGGGATTVAGGAGGGSGYIGNPILKDKVMYCYNCEESTEESTKTISTTCSEETPTSNCAKKGNGYARITLISIEN